MSPRGGYPLCPLPSKTVPKSKSEMSIIACISHDQSIDISLLRSNEKFQSDWQKLAKNVGMHVNSVT